MPDVVKMKTQEAQMIVPDSLMDKKGTHNLVLSPETPRLKVKCCFEGSQHFSRAHPVHDFTLSDELNV